MNNKTLILIILLAIMVLAGFGFTKEIWATYNWTTGKLSSALQLDGVESYVTIGNVYNGVKSIEFWVKPDDITSHTDYVIDLNGTDYIKIVDGEVTVNNISDPTYYVDGISGEQTIPDTTNWHHVVITTETGINASDLDIGRLQGTGFFGGQIKEVKLYNRALSAVEVRHHYNKAGPIAYWKFEEAGGSTAYDSGQPSGGNNCTISGAAWIQGKFGSGLDFMPNDNLSCGDVYNGVKTVSFWLRADSLTNYVLDLNGTQTITVSNGTIQANNFTSPKIYVDGRISANLSDLDWHHIAVTTNSGINASAVYLGKVSSNYLDGRLDEVRFYQYPRTAEQILQDYNAGFQIYFR